MNWTLFFLASLTTYRLAYMASSEEGPGALIAKMRRQVPAKTNPGRGIRCLYCWSIWIAAAITLILRIPWDIAFFYWMSLSAVAIAIHQTFTKD